MGAVVSVVSDKIAFCVAPRDLYAVLAKGVIQEVFGLRGSRRCAMYLALALLVGTSVGTLGAEYPWVWFAYDHGYFVRNEDNQSDAWHTEETIPWARWNFWFMSDEAGVFPFRMDLESDIPIDEDLWYTPEFLASSTDNGSYEYSWRIGEQPGSGNVDGPCFQLVVDQRVDPGVSFQRVMTPATVPPGTSTVRADVTISVERHPTINGVEMNVGEVWAQVFAHSQCDELTVLGCEIITRSGPWELNNSDSWPTYGVRMNLSGSQMGNEFSVSLRFAVENTSDSTVLFKPVAEINWETRIPLYSQVRRSRASGSMAFELEGPNGETLHVRATPQGQFPIVDWDIEPMQFHGAIWAYWPLVIEKAGEE